MEILKSVSVQCRLCNSIGDPSGDWVVQHLLRAPKGGDTTLAKHMRETFSSLYSVLVMAGSVDNEHSAKEEEYSM